jgi:hypothetical protein
MQHSSIQVFDGLRIGVPHVAQGRHFPAAVEAESDHMECPPQHTSERKGVSAPTFCYSTSKSTQIVAKDSD